MQISWWTLALQAVNFLVLVWLLQRFLYRPVKDVIERRKALAGQAAAAAEAKQAEAEAARQRFEDQRAQLSAERQEMLKQAHQALEAERGKMLEAAHADAARIVEDARKSIAEERKATLAGMRDQTADLAAELAADLMRRTGPAAPGDAVLDQLEQRLGALAADERDRLRNDVAADGASLTVVTAAPLGPADQDRWRARLAGVVGEESRMEFATDPDILGGAELRFPHSVLRFTLADQLAKARKRMTGNDDTA